MTLRRLAVFGIVAALFVTLTPTDAIAGRADDYDRLQRDIAETRAKLRQARTREKRIMAELSQSDARRMSLERSLAFVTDRLTLASRRLDTLQLLADAAATELNEKQAQLQRAIAALDNFTGQMENRAANIYMRGPDAYSAVLFGAGDFHQYVAGMAYAESVLNTDVNIVDDIRELRDAIDLERAALEERRALLDRQTNAVAAQQRQLGALRVQQSNARVAVLNEIGYKERLLRRVRNERRAYGQALQSMLEQSRSIEALLQRAQRGQRVIQGHGGYLKWPVSGQITSPYGWRTHPIYKTRSFHTGIDIGSPAGTTIKAARRGEVLYVGTREAYGLVVIVDHGNAVATVYAHLSRAYVRAGQAVGTLGSIGAVGCTGWCTGPHLHFEVRVNGQHQNPMRWL
jgi:murein DD-endopeptidase MepM/ murein hydrolase activator NlpD